jgi:hypothetical protein
MSQKTELISRERSLLACENFGDTSCEVSLNLLFTRSEVYQGLLQ